MSTKLYVKNKWDDDIPEILTVYGIKGIHSLATRDCIVNVVEEPESTLLVVDICGKRRRIRVLKSAPDIGVVLKEQDEQMFEDTSLLTNCKHGFGDKGE